jgi:MFS family permease
MGPSGGTLLATGAIGLLALGLNDQDFVVWGWRIPFVASLVLVFFGLWLRKGVEETPVFRQLESTHRTLRLP